MNTEHPEATGGAVATLLSPLTPVTTPKKEVILPDLAAEGITKVEEEGLHFITNNEPGEPSHVMV